MQNLLPGLRKFSEAIFPKNRQLFESLSQRQNPHALIITCSDSRIDPNMVTQTIPGEIFVIRNAGNIIPPFGVSSGGEQAAIEFAVDGLQVSNIVICGHSQCGAMAALIDKINLESLPCVKNWLKHASATKKRMEIESPDGHSHNVVEENVLVQVDNIKTHPSVSAALRAGRIHIYGWVYNFESGIVKIYDPRSKQYVPSIEVKEEAEKDANRFSL